MIKGLNGMIAVIMLSALLFFSGCYAVEIITAVEGLPDAENSIATRDGRFFVTCTNGVYEIRKNPDGNSEFEYVKETVISESGLFTGIAEYNGVLYTTLMKSVTETVLKSINLSTGEVKTVYRFTKVLMPNGIAFDAAGNLYVNDMIDLSLTLGRIIKLAIDHSSCNVTGESIWLDCGLAAPNGMKYYNNSLLVTDLGSVKRIPVVNGRPGTMTVLYTRASMLDDLAVYGNNLIVCDNLKGTVFELDYSVRGGKVLRELDAESISGPSSIVHGSSTNGLFNKNCVVVTSKGIIYELNSNIGNSLVYFYPQ